MQLARLSGGCLFVTALGDDDRGHAAKRELEAMGVEVRAAWRSEPQRRAFVYLDASGERTITVIGERLTPRAEDPLPWPELERCDGIYLTAGDRDAVRAARGARSLVATVRALPELNEAGVEIDALVSSANDEGERYIAGDLDPAPRLVVANRRRRRRRAARSGGRHQHSMGSRTAARAGCGHLRRRRLVRGRPHLWARGAGLRSGGGGGAGRALRRGLRDGARALRGTAHRRPRPMGGRCETLGSAMMKRETTRPSRPRAST